MWHDPCCDFSVFTLKSLCHPIYSGTTIVVEILKYVYLYMFISWTTSNNKKIRTIIIIIMSMTKVMII